MNAHAPIAQRGQEAAAIVTAHQQAVAEACAARSDLDRAAYTVAAELAAAYYIAARQDRAAALTTLDHLLEVTSPDLPDFAPFYGEGRQSCETWAALAADSMVVNMLGACLQRIDRQPLARVNAMKRAMVAIWNTLPAKDRAAFLTHVSDGGP
jgi:hypothetical protein